MKAKITHTTCYKYEDKVFIEPHVLRLKPRPDRHVKILSSDLIINPKPSGMAEIIECDGTLANLIWFNMLTDIFEIQMAMEVETTPFNPFDFLIYPSTALRLPMFYPGEWSRLLTPYFQNNHEISEVEIFANDIGRKCDYITVDFLTALCKIIYDDFEYVKRDKGAPMHPAETLLTKKGSCRDFVVLAMAACRHFGLACRYASGYYLTDDKKEVKELHAWFEVFLPGAGWKGFDPTNGIACDHHHITLSAAADPSMTLPVSGTYRGLAMSKMMVNLSVD